jgi:hypothetical protein
MPHESWRELSWSGCVKLHNQIGKKETIDGNKETKSIISFYEMQKSASKWIPPDFIKKKTEKK